jgi:hypothetical protein
VLEYEKVKDKGMSQTQLLIVVVVFAAFAICLALRFRQLKRRSIRNATHIRSLTEIPTWSALSLRARAEAQSRAPRRVRSIIEPQRESHDI